MKYAIYRGTATNIGEEIQSIAAERFLPSVDYYITKEQMGHFWSEEKTKLIMNAWYMERAAEFPPRDCVEPLLVSMHFSSHRRDAILSKPESVAFFRKYGPVGCRDLSTMKWLEENGIPAYFSGCLTSTLLPNENLRKKYPDKYILCVDCKEPTVDYVRQHADYPVYCLSKQISPCILSKDRMEVAKAFLYLYQNAYCVITSNLHTVIPCLAFNTRVCLITIDWSKHDSWAAGRFDGMEGFFHEVTEDSFLAGAYDFNHPVENPKAFEKSRDALIEKCRAFTGFDANRPTLDDDFNPLRAVMSAISAEHRVNSNSYGVNRLRIKRALYYARPDDLLEMYELKKTKNVNCHDIPTDQL